MMKFKHFETVSGKFVMNAEFDGYNIADRMLEGVMFQVSINPDGTLSISVKKEHEEYFSNFNREMFLKKAEEYVINSFKRDDEFTDPISKEDCFLVEMEDQKDNSDDTTEDMNELIETKVKKIDLIDQIIGTSSNTNEVVNDNDEEKEEEKVIGKFKPKRKFLNFVQGRKGGVRYHSKTALIEGKQLSGMLDETYFKVSICDEGTINFEEVDTQNTNDEMIQRLIDDIDSRDVTGYMKKYVVYGIEFKDEDGKKMYLEVEESKPIDKLFSLFDETEKEEVKSDISENGLSILDKLFNDGNSETENEETPEKEETTMTFAQQMMAEAFEAMNKEKIEELQDRIEKKEEEVVKYEMTYKSAQKSFDATRKDLRVLKTRLEDMKPKAQPNGVVFYVSPENKSEIEPSDDVKMVVKKVSESLRLINIFPQEDLLLKLITEGYFTLKFADKDDLQNSDQYVLQKDKLIVLNNLKTFGKLTMVSNNEFEFRGDLNWHQIVDKLIKFGFEQDPEWDKVCGSPSYQSHFGMTQSNTFATMSTGLNQKSIGTSSNTLNNKVQVSETKETNFKAVHYETYKEPTTLVVLDTTGLEDSPRGIEINDDYTSIPLFIGGKKVSEYESGGFINILTLDEYNKLIGRMDKEDLYEMSMAISGFVVPNFKGDIEIFAKNDETGEFTTNFDLSTYIQHQLSELDEEAYYEVGLNFPEGTITFDLNTDLSLPKSIVRDIKIESVLDK
jgi:hypothetical protein